MVELACHYSHLHVVVVVTSASKCIYLQSYLNGIYGKRTILCVHMLIYADQLLIARPNICTILFSNCIIYNSKSLYNLSPDYTNVDCCVVTPMQY
jgi:hypothetical protein